MTDWWQRTDLAQTLGSPIAAGHQLSGGDVAESFRLRLQDGRTVFAKTHADPPPRMFSTEAGDLEWLGQAKTVAVPQVLAFSDGGGATSGNAADAPAFLILEWIEEGSRAGDAGEESFGRDLAALHSLNDGVQDAVFGRPDGRTTGSLALPNTPATDWAMFYADARLRALATIGEDRGALPGDVVRSLRTLADRLAEGTCIIAGPPEPPARLHGDLWAGNRLVDASGRNWLIDPNSHYGHRESDLAMMALFGGFADSCWRAYDEASPLTEGWRDRVLLHQITPLAIHAIKFSGGYVASTRRAVMRYL